MYFKICICVCVNIERENIEREKDRGIRRERDCHDQSDGVSESTNTRQMRFKWSLRVKQKTRKDIEGNVFH